MKILVTGATGMLGRAVMRRFDAEWNNAELVGLCHSRTGPGLVTVDLTDAAALDAALTKYTPDVIVHTAAIRKPDDFAADVAAARRLNVDVTATLARWTAADPRRFLAYVSSDYVFDGTTPPYRPDDPTHPINAYGVSKLDGEKAVRAVAEKQAAILRVPVLYGDVENLQESSVTTVIEQVLKLARPGAAATAGAVPGTGAAAPAAHPLVLDDWAVRYPTHVLNVADILSQIAWRRLAGTFHWSGEEALTKLDMGRIVADLIGVDESRLVGSGAPANGSEPRPKDCHLDRSALEDLGITTPGITFVETAARLAVWFA